MFMVLAHEYWTLFNMLTRLQIGLLFWIMLVDGFGYWYNSPFHSRGLVVIRI